MSKTLRVLVIFLLADAVIIGGYFLVRSLGSGGSAAAAAKSVAWVTMDESYQPGTELEQFIKTDAEANGLLPLQFRSHGRSAAVLKRFRGAKLVGANVPVLEMQFKGVEDWAIVELWIKTEDGREIRRTVLYVLTDNAWKVGDSGRLAE